jgi:hypothetical protein
MISVLMDAISASRIEKFAGFPAGYISNMQLAIAASAQLLVTSEVSEIDAYFQEGTGALANSVTQGLNTIALTIGGKGEVDVTVNEPYANRRDFGFHGTDSLGRRYDDPARGYSENAITDVQEEAHALYEAAVMEAWAAIG